MVSPTQKYILQYEHRYCIISLLYIPVSSSSKMPCRLQGPWKPHSYIRFILFIFLSLQRHAHPLIYLGFAKKRFPQLEQVTFSCPLFAGSRILVPHSGQDTTRWSVKAKILLLSRPTIISSPIKKAGTQAACLFIISRCAP